MGQLTLGEQAAPATPASGVTIYPTVATPSILRVIDDAGNDTSLATRGVANTFTAANVFAPTSTSVIGVDVNMPTGTSARAIRGQINGVERFLLLMNNSDTQIQLQETDTGAAVGPRIMIARNNNGSTPSAGTIRLANLSASTYYIWPDASGNLRIGTTAPTNAQDTSGTVVGTQTSMAEAKHISDELSSLADVLERVQGGAGSVRRFAYRSGSYNKQEFEGVVTDLAPHYGMDRDADHPQGKSLNQTQIIGDLLRTVDWLVERVAELEAKQHGTT